MVSHITNLSKMCRNCILSRLIFSAPKRITASKLHQCLFTTTVRRSAHSKRSDKVKFSQRVFSGIQPTGIPHLGNYVGAIRNWVKLQEKYDHMILSVVDLHSITVTQEPKELRENIYKMTACLLAAGIDPKKCILFQQSMVPQHCELSWIFSCMCTVPTLMRMPQWKEKSEKVKDPSVGLLTYPILQSADILLYKATDVPVGEDQIHHVQLTRDIAHAFNNKFGVLFPRPQVIMDTGARIKSLQNPAIKMSKSDTNQRSRIDLTDSPDIVTSKLKKAVSDTTRTISYDPENRPGIANLISIHSALTDIPPEQIVNESTSLDKVEYKMKVAEVVNETIQPISKEITRLLADRDYLQNVLKLGAEKASEIADKTMTEVKQKVGIS